MPGTRHESGCTTSEDVVLNESPETHRELLELSPGNASSQCPLAACHDGGFCDDRRSKGPIVSGGRRPQPHQLCH